MAKRKSLFEMLTKNENVDLCLEYKIIVKILELPYKVNNFDSIEDAIDKYIIKNWKYSYRCIELNDLRKKLKITRTDIRDSNYDLEKCLLYFELMYNLVQELINRYNDIYDYDVQTVNEEDVNIIINNIKSLLEELNYKIIQIEDRYIIVEKDIIATAVAEKNIDICADIIEYRRFNLKGDVDTKKSIILKLADKIEPLRVKFNATSYKTIMEELQMLLNNLNLRHNNLEGTYKKEYVASMSKEELETWYDKTYDMCLGVLILNDYLDVNSEIKKLKTKIK